MALLSKMFTRWKWESLVGSPNFSAEAVTPGRLHHHLLILHGNTVFRSLPRDKMVTFTPSSPQSSSLMGNEGLSVLHNTMAASDPTADQNFRWFRNWLDISVVLRPPRSRILVDPSMSLAYQSEGSLSSPVFST